MRTKVTLLLPVAVLCGAVAASAACTSGRLDVGADGDAATEPTTFTAEQVKAAQAACSASDTGAKIAVFHTPSELIALLAGAWLSCSPGLGTFTPLGMDGIYSAGGQWNELTDDGHGGLVEEQGLTTSGTYQVIPSRRREHELRPGRVHDQLRPRRQQGLRNAVPRELRVVSPAHVRRAELVRAARVARERRVSKKP